MDTTAKKITSSLMFIKKSDYQIKKPTNRNYVVGTTLSDVKTQTLRHTSCTRYTKTFDNCKKCYNSNIKLSLVNSSRSDCFNKQSHIY
jgi:hypothetical protein